MTTTPIPYNSPFGREFPLAAAEDAHWTDRVVTEGHAQYCQTWGHATYKIDGKDQGFCPRCGDRTEIAGTRHGGFEGHPEDCDGTCGV